MSLATQPPNIDDVRVAGGSGGGADGTGCGRNGTALCTRGGQTVVVTGANFGPAAARGVVVVCSTSGGDPSPVAPRVVFALTDCAVVAADVAIECTSSPGFGSPLQVRAL